jgi:hypothetical protein
VTFFMIDILVKSHFSPTRALWNLPPSRAAAACDSASVLPTLEKRLNVSKIHTAVSVEVSRTRDAEVHFVAVDRILA